MMNNRQGGDALINFVSSMFSKGGSVAPMKKAASALEKQGRRGDTELVHVTPGELSLLERIGAGTTNPVTGLREFYAADGVDAGDVGTDEGAGADSPGAVGVSDGGPDSESDPMGMADVAAAAEEAVAARGTSAEDQVSAAIDAISAMDDAMQGGGDAEAVAEAVDQLAKDQLGISPRPSGIAGAIQKALDLDRNGKVSPMEVALGLATPIGSVVGLSRGLAGLMGPTPDTVTPGMLGPPAEQEVDISEPDTERGEDEVAPEIAEELTVEALTRPPTIDIVPFRPQDFYYFTQQQRYGLPSMMNMRTR